MAQYFPVFIARCLFRLLSTSIIFIILFFDHALGIYFDFIFSVIFLYLYFVKLSFKFFVIFKSAITSLIETFLCFVFAWSCSYWWHLFRVLSCNFGWCIGVLFDLLIYFMMSLWLLHVMISWLLLDHCVILCSINVANLWEVAQEVGPHNMVLLIGKRKIIRKLRHIIMVVLDKHLCVDKLTWLIYAHWIWLMVMKWSVNKFPLSLPTLRTSAKHWFV